ncbi:hypothetical protein ABZ929_02095 [Streptomyces physcomitrii]|uniref:hypothetical protein n=1 Tax=Streptomyces physcomitrii TaxID=2724184 RepID=UPI0033F4CDC4
MARHAAPRTSPAARTLLRAGLTLGAAGAALAAGTAAAGAATFAGEDSGSPAARSEAPAPESAAPAKSGPLDVTSALGAVSDLKLNPLAQTGVDPLDNGISTQVADFKPVSTKAVTGPLSDGDSLSELPVVGSVTRGLLG